MPQVSRTGRRQVRATLLIGAFAVAGVTLWVLAPLYLAIILSFKPAAHFFQGTFLPWIDFQPTLENWRSEARNFWYPSGMGPALVNSLIVGALSSLLAVVLGGLAAWSMVRAQFTQRATWLIFALLLAPRLLPPLTIALPWTLIMRAVGLLDTHAALILAHTALLLPWAFLILSGVSRMVPQSVVDAAALDGAGELTLLTRVVLPLIMPTASAAWLLCFALSWNEYPFAMLNAGMHLTTAPVAVSQLFTKDGIEFDFVGSHLVLTTLPPLILALLARRYVTRALSAGAHD